MNTLIMIMGRSGSGKSTVYNYIKDLPDFLKDRLNIKEAPKLITNRPKRNKSDDEYIFRKKDIREMDRVFKYGKWSYKLDVHNIMKSLKYSNIFMVGNLDYFYI